MTPNLGARNQGNVGYSRLQEWFIVSLCTAVVTGVVITSFQTSPLATRAADTIMTQRITSPVGQHSLRRPKSVSGPTGVSNDQSGSITSLVPPLQTRIQPQRIVNATQRNPRDVPLRATVSQALNKSLNCGPIPTSYCEYNQTAEKLDPRSEYWLSAYNVSFGIDRMGADARIRPSSAYSDRLGNSRIVITNQPFPWEGDWRLAEAMASGALVLANFMVDAPPGIENGQNIVLFNTTDHMLELLRWYLEHPDAGDDIAAAGRALALNHWSSEKFAETMVNSIWPLPKKRPLRVVMYTDPAEKTCAHYFKADPVFILFASHNVTRVRSLAEADMLVLSARTPYTCPVNKSHDKVVAAQEAAMIQAAKAAGVLVTVVDELDRPYSLARGHQAKWIDFHFKRSRVCRAQQSFVEYDRPTLPFYYPLKDAIRKQLEPNFIPRAHRSIDVTYCFPVYKKPSDS